MRAAWPCALVVASLGCQGSGSAPTPGRSDAADRREPAAASGSLSLASADDGEPVRLDALCEQGPAVLVFGSYSSVSFRMKVPRLEALARRWEGRARVAFVFSREAHPRGEGAARLSAEADRLLASDGNGDGLVTREEFAGSARFFDACDVDGDDRIAPHEALVMRRIGEFVGVEAPRDPDDRRALAQAFRRQVPGRVPLLLDTEDDAVGTFFEAGANGVVVLDRRCEVVAEQDWADPRQLHRELEALTGAAPPAVAPALDWSPVQAELAAATDAGQRVLLVLRVEGCEACAREEAVLADPEVRLALAGLTLLRRDLADDAVWALFEGLELSTTPALLLIDPATTTVRARRQGFQPRPAVLEMLATPIP